MRIALACAQITAPKAAIKDGFSKLVVKADWDKLKNKKAAPLVLQAEALMSAGWDLVQQSQLPLEQMALPFGKFQIRLALHLLQKESKGRENVQYKSMAEIKAKFEEDVVNINKQDSSVAPSSASSNTTCVKGLADASNAKAIALEAHKHIKVGKWYTLKNAGTIWHLIEVTDDMVKLQHKPFFGNVEEKEIPHKDLKLLKEWTKPVPVLIDEQVKTRLLPCGSPFLAEELSKAQAQCLLIQKYKEILGGCFQKSNFSCVTAFVLLRISYFILLC